MRPRFHMKYNNMLNTRYGSDPGSESKYKIIVYRIRLPEWVRSINHVNRAKRFPFVEEKVNIIIGAIKPFFKKNCTS